LTKIHYTFSPEFLDAQRARYNSFYQFNEQQLDLLIGRLIKSTSNLNPKIIALNNKKSAEYLAA